MNGRGVPSDDLMIWRSGDRDSVSVTDGGECASARLKDEHEHWALDALGRFYKLQPSPNSAGIGFLEVKSLASEHVTHAVVI